MQKTLSIIFSLFFIAGCVGIKPASSSKANRYFETFYVGEEGIQYFIKPIAFTGENNSTLLGDFNFRSAGDSTSDVIFNFSIKSEEFYKNIDSLVLKNESFSVQANGISLTYNESGKQYTSRFTSTIPGGRNIIDLFSSENWEIEVYSNQSPNTFSSEKRKTQRKILSLREHLFIFLK
jgi:hypothetical protein